MTKKNINGEPFTKAHALPGKKKHVNILKQQLDNLYDPYVTQTSQLF